MMDTGGPYHLCPDEEEKDQNEWTTLCGILCTTKNNVKAQYLRRYFSISINVGWCKNCMRTKDFTLQLLASVP
jgi:hypothetical protein